jgi:hypothetical protein
MMCMTSTSTRIVLATVLAIFMLGSTTAAYADTRQSNSCTPECPAGANPQPWGVGARGEDAIGNPGTSMAPQVPAGERPNPNP